MGYDKAKVKESIEPENVYDILEYFGAEPEMYSDYIISRTICHNGIGEGSKKLYYYFENSMFNCYTECGAFDIFELVEKVKNVDLNSAIYFVVNFLNLQIDLDNDIDLKDSQEDWKIFNRYKEQKDVTVMIIPLSYQNMIYLLFSIILNLLFPLGLISQKRCVILRKFIMTLLAVISLFRTSTRTIGA